MSDLEALLAKARRLAKERRWGGRGSPSTLRF